MTPEFDEYGKGRVEPVQAPQRPKVSSGSLKSRISSRILKTKPHISSHQMDHSSKQRTSPENSEILRTPKTKVITSSNTQNMELNFQNPGKKFETSIESAKHEASQTIMRISEQTPVKEDSFRKQKQFGPNIKLAESNIQVTQSNLMTQPGPSGPQETLMYDQEFIKALRQMKESITKIKQFGASELKAKNDNSWMGREGTEELAAIKAGLGGDVSRVQMISNFSVLSDFDRSGDTLLNLEKYLGGLSVPKTGQTEELRRGEESLAKLKFYLEKVRVLLGKGGRD